MSDYTQQESSSVRFGGEDVSEFKWLANISGVYSL